MELTVTKLALALVAFALEMHQSVKAANQAFMEVHVLLVIQVVLHAMIPSLEMELVLFVLTLKPFGVKTVISLAHVQMESVTN